MLKNVIIYRLLFFETRQLYETILKLGGGELFFVDFLLKLHQ